MTSTTPNYSSENNILKTLFDSENSINDPELL